jgi:hypothetical protein
MALTLILEDGTGKADANSYASRADGNAYHEGHTAAGDWTAATDAQKDAALVMATRVIDAMFRFGGWKRTTTQALLWPRVQCPDVELSGRETSPLGSSAEVYVPEDAVPVCVRDATCELARRLLTEDRTGDADGLGLRSLSLEGAVRMVFDPLRLRPVVPQFVAAMLARVGAYEGRRSGAVPLIRV